MGHKQLVRRPDQISTVWFEFQIEEEEKTEI